MNINRRGFLFGSAAAATLAGCATNKMGLRELKPGEKRAVALIGDEATVKRFYKENGHYRLQPENPTMEPVIVDEVIILGQVISSFRFYF